MNRKHKLLSYVLLATIILAFFIDKTYGLCLVAFILLLTFILQKELIRMFSKAGFLIFIIAALGTPLIIDFSLHKFMNNLFIVIRGILIFVWLYFFTKNISSSKAYQLLKKLLPNEMISLVHLSFAVIPIMQKQTIDTASKLKAREISLSESISLFFSNTLETAETNLKSPHIPPKKVFIVTGKIHEGKTTLLSKIVDQAIKDGFKVGGIIAEYKKSPKGFREYHVVDTKTSKSMKLITTEPIDSYKSKFQSYYFLKDGTEFAVNSISLDYLDSEDVVVLDEIGALELENGGYAQKITPLLESNIPVLIFVVRDTFLKQICKKFGIIPTQVIKVGPQATSFRLRDSVRVSPC